MGLIALVFTCAFCRVNGMPYMQNPAVDRVHHRSTANITRITVKNYRNGSVESCISAAILAQYRPYDSTGRYHPMKLFFPK